jgi:hypothetical protein
MHQEEFMGKCEELSGHIYACFNSKQVNTFASTTKEIANYVSLTFDHGSNSYLTVENVALPTLVNYIYWRTMLMKLRSSY